VLHRLGIAAGRGLSYYVCKLLHRLRCWEFSLKSAGSNADNITRTIPRHSRMNNNVKVNCVIGYYVIWLSTHEPQ